MAILGGAGGATVLVPFTAKADNTYPSGYFQKTMYNAQNQAFLPGWDHDGDSILLNTSYTGGRIVYYDNTGTGVWDYTAVNFHASASHIQGVCRISGLIYVIVAWTGNLHLCTVNQAGTITAIGTSQPTVAPQLAEYKLNYWFGQPYGTTNLIFVDCHKDGSGMLEIDITDGSIVNQALSIGGYNAVMQQGYVTSDHRAIGFYQTDSGSDGGQAVFFNHNWDMMYGGGGNLFPFPRNSNNRTYFRLLDWDGYYIPLNNNANYWWPTKVRYNKKDIDEWAIKLADHAGVQSLW